MLLMATDDTHGASITPVQAALARKVFAELLRTRTQDQLAEELNTTRSTISRAKEGRTGLLRLLEAAKLAGTPPEEVEAAGIPVLASAVPAGPPSGELPREAILRLLAEEENISQRALNIFFAQRPPPLDRIRLTEALSMLRGIELTGRPFPPGKVGAAVDDLLDAPGKKR